MSVPPYYTRRPGDPGLTDDDPRWGVLGGNPSPGSPEALTDLAELSQQQSATAEDLYGRVADLALGIGDSGWAGETAEAFSARFSRLHPKLLSAHTSWDALASAMSRWSEILSVLRADARNLLEVAEAAWAERDDAMQAAAAAHQALGAAEAGSDAAAAAQQALAEARRRIEAAEQTLHNARLHADGIREIHTESAFNTTAIVRGRTPEDPFYDDSLEEAILRHMGAVDLLAAQTESGDLDDLADLTHELVTPWLYQVGTLTDLMVAVPSSGGVIAGLLESADGVLMALLDDLADGLPWDQVASAEVTGEDALSDVQEGTLAAGLPEPPGDIQAVRDLILTAPTIPTDVGTQLLAMPRIELPRITIPTPLRYFTWLESAADLLPDSPAPSWLDDAGGVQAVLGPDLDVANDNFAAAGGTSIPVPPDPVAAR